MNSNNTDLGSCPDCGTQIPATWLLIEYETDDGTESVWAECPECEDVVSPE
jgi:hypothetical protein